MPVLPPVPESFPGLSPSALDIIKSALRLIGALDPDEEPEGAEAQDALEILNQLIDDWNSERLMVYGIEILEFDLTVSQQTYTLGVNGDFDIARPARIDAAGIVMLNNPAQPLEIPIEVLDSVGWSEIPVKNITSTVPLKMYNDESIPYMNLSFWPIPTAPIKVRLYCWIGNAKFTDLDMLIVVPPSYIKALRYCLAVDLAPEWGMPVPEAVAAQAILSRAKIKSFNTPAYTLTVGAEYGAGRGYWDYRSDTFTRGGR